MCMLTIYTHIYIIKLHLRCLVPLQLWQGSYEAYRVSFHGDLCHLGTQHNIASTRTVKTDSCSVAGGYAGSQMQLRRATLVSCDRGEEKLGPHRQLVLLMYI